MITNVEIVNGTFVVPLRRRPRWKRILISPRVFLSHYRLLRRKNGVRQSVVAAFELTRLLCCKDEGATA